MITPRFHEATEDRFVLRARIPVLEVCAARASNEEGIPGKDAIDHREAVGVIGVAGRIDDTQAGALDFNPIPIGNAHRDHVGLGLLPHHCDAAGAVSQRAKPRNVVGVEVGVDGLDQPQIELVEKLGVTGDK